MEENYTDRFYNATARIDKLIWIPASIGEGAISDDMKSMLEDLYAGNRQIESRLPRMDTIMKSKEEPDGEWVAETLAYVDGFFAQMARPIPQVLGTRQAYSWGYCQTEWVYAETLDELMALVEDFSDRVVKESST